MEVAEPLSLPLKIYMADKAALWATMTGRYGLQLIAYDHLVAECTAFHERCDSRDGGDVTSMVSCSLEDACNRKGSRNTANSSPMCRQEDRSRLMAIR